MILLPLRSFLYNLPVITRYYKHVTIKSGKKTRHCKATVSILCLYVILYTLLLNYIPPTSTLAHSFAYFLISGYLLLTPHISGVDCITVAWTHFPCYFFFPKQRACSQAITLSICTLLGYIPTIHTEKNWDFFWNSIWIHVLRQR